MAYTPRQSYGDIEIMVQQRGNALLNAIKEGKLLYDKWYQLTYGLSDQQILALDNMQGVTQSELTALKYAIGVFNDVANGTALPAATRDAYLVPFL